MGKGKKHLKENGNNGKYTCKECGKRGNLSKGTETVRKNSKSRTENTIYKIKNLPVELNNKLEVMKKSQYN